MKLSSAHFSPENPQIPFFTDIHQKALQEFPSLSEWLTPDQSKYFVWAGYHTYFQTFPHETVKSTNCLFYQSRVNLFKPLSSFHDRNRMVGWFDLIQDKNYAKNLAAAWKVTDSTAEFFQGISDWIFEDKRRVLAVTQNSKPPKKHSTGISRNTATGDRCTFTKIKVCSENYFNVDNVIELYHNSDWKDNTNLKNQLFNLLHSCYYKDGIYIPQIYIQKPSGRLYLSGTSLQNVKSIIKVAALKGCCEVDMENAHYQIFNQLCNRLGIQNNYIEQYLANKTEWRTSIAKDVEVPVADVKTALISLIFGAGLKFGMSMEETLGKEALAKVMLSEKIQGITKELKNGRRRIINSHRYKFDGRKMSKGCFNGMGMFVESDCPRSLLAFILQGYEAACMKIMLENSQTEAVLLQHDGVTFRGQEDTDLFSQKIEESLGFRIEFSVSIL